jgi:hypothetical protein
MKWYAVFGAGMFLVISTYVSIKHVFWSGATATLLQQFAFVAALVALIFGLLSLPRWQSFFALAVVAYAFYWLTHIKVAIP